MVWTPEQRASLVPFPAIPEKDAEPAGTVVAFHTPDKIYVKEARRLRASVERLDLPIEIREVPSAGSWVRNAGLKPSVLVELRKELRGPLLYVDADAVFHRSPWRFLSAYHGDIGVYYEHGERLISATVLIHDTPAAAGLLEEWANRCATEPTKWDQILLEELIEDDRHRPSPLYRVSQLPVSMCWIFDRDKNGPADAVFIEQLQASRETLKTDRLFRGVGKRLRRRRERTRQIEGLLGLDDHPNA